MQSILMMADGRHPRDVLRGFIESASKPARPLTPVQEAAPELLEALQDLCDTLGECGMTEKARAAITKATGGNDE